MVLISGFATLDDFRRAQMAVIHFEIPGRIGRLSHHRGRRAASNVAGRLVATFREWRRRAYGRAELARLDNRMLQDIGISRADAEFLSSRPFWRE
jgi:uncharacterized protein YjiS (DUF1127 family)